MTDAQLHDIFLKLLAKKIGINIYPIDSWDSWTYHILLEDGMCPFYIAYEHEGEFTSYMDALRHGVTYVLETIQHAKELTH